MGSRLVHCVLAGTLALISFAAVAGCSGGEGVDAKDSIANDIKSANIQPGTSSKGGSVKKMDATPPSKGQ